MNAVVEHNPKPEKSAYEQLPRRYRRFVDEYVAGLTGTAAIRAAGCKSQHARSIASKLLRKPEIAAAVEQRQQELIAEVGFRQLQVFEQMASIAGADPRKLVDPETGEPIPLQHLDSATAAAISAVEVENISINGETGKRYKYKFWDKPKANDRIGQFLKMWDAPGAKVNVDARRVTLNNHDPAGQGLLQAVLRLGEQIAAGRPADSIEAPGADGSVLPAEIPAESSGPGAPVVVAKVPRGSKKP